MEDDLMCSDDSPNDSDDDLLNYNQTNDTMTYLKNSSRNDAIAVSDINVFCDFWK